MRGILAAMIALAAFSVPLSAQSSDLRTARQQIERLDVANAAVTLSRVLVREDLSGMERTRANVLMAVVHLSLGAPARATTSFRDALWSDPSIRVDSLAHLHSQLMSVFSTELARWDSQLRVTTSPTGASVAVGDVRLGRTPVLRVVPSGMQLEVRVEGVQSVKVVNTVAPSRRMLSIEVQMPEDTLPLPTMSPVDAQRRLLLGSVRTQWSPSRLAPLVVPRELEGPDQGRALGLLIGGGLGFGASVNACVEPDVPDEKKCKIAMTLLFGLLGFGVGAIFDDSRQKGVDERYNEYVDEAAEWRRERDREREEWIQERLNVRLSEFRQEWQAVVTQNRATLARNRLLPEPVVQLRPIRN